MPSIGKKKYFSKIYLGSASIIVLSIIALSAIVYANVDKIVFDHEMATNEKLLGQVEYNINLINTNAQNICQTVYYNQDVRSVMLLTGEETFEHMKTIMMLDSSIVQTNSFVQSIYVYNNLKHVYYSTFGTFRHEDPYLTQYVESVEVVPVLRPIMRKAGIFSVGMSEKEYDVLSYFMYEMTDHEGRMDGAVIVNFQLDWLIDNVRMINREDSAETGSLFILSDNEEFIRTGYADTYDEENLKRELMDFYASEKDALFSTADGGAAMYKVNLRGNDYLLTTIKIRQANWVMLRLQPYAAIFAYMQQLRASIVLISALAVLFTCGAAFIASKSLYKPIAGLVQYVATLKGEPQMGARETADEFSYLTSAYDTISQELKGFRLNEQRNGSILRNYFLKRLLVDSGTVTADEFKTFREEHASPLNADTPFVVCVIKLDHHHNDARSRSALKFAITNVFSERLSAYGSEAIDMGYDEITMILSLPDSRPDGVADIRAFCEQGVSALEKEYGLSLTVSISVEGHGFAAITPLYNEALGNARYRIVYGSGSVFSAEQIQRSQSGHIDFSAEEALIALVRAGDVRAAQQKLYAVFRQIKGLTYTDIQFSLSHLAHSIETVVYELNQRRVVPLDISASLTAGGEGETLPEIQEAFSRLINRILNVDSAPNTKKQAIAADTIKEYIENNYFDINLSAYGIAGMLRLSPSTISKLFKENANMSIPEYINDVRLKHAVQWMRNSNLSIVEIMKKVGIENESYFYKIFKAKFGTTPRGFQRTP